jgi:pimeloyl-ACP methyl ester carboxylesterase
MIPIVGKIGLYLLPSSYQVKEGYRYAFFDDSKIPQEMVKKLSKSLSSKNAKYAFSKANEELVPDDIDKMSKRYDEIEIPTLIIWGKNDIVIRVKKAFKLHKDLKNSELVIIPNCGHIPHEEKPREVLKAIDRFLKDNG